MLLKAAKLIAALAVTGIASGLLAYGQPARNVSAGTAFSFNWLGKPASPQPWHPAAINDWDLLVHDRDTNGGKPYPSMTAAHGPDCGPYPATHPVSDMDNTVFLCNNHVMTALNSPGYGEIMMTPAQLADFSSGPVAIDWKVSTLRTTNRDWLDVSVTPFAENLVTPGTVDVDLEGRPRDWVACHMADTAPTVWNCGLMVNGQRTPGGYGHGTLEETLAAAGQTVSEVTRIRYELLLSKTHLKFWLPDYNKAFVDTDIQPLSWSQGIVQLGHHDYDAGKQCTQTEPLQPALCTNSQTWHWSDFSISNAVPFTMLRLNPGTNQTLGGGSTVLRYSVPMPAPAGSYLRFSGTGNSLSFSTDGGATWTQAVEQTGEIAMIGKSPWKSYFMPIPAGATQVQFRGQDNSFGPWIVQDPSVWSQTTSSTPPAALSASATASPTSGSAPLAVNFNGSASGGTAPYSYSWDFGDSTAASTSQNPSHTYAIAGTYNAKLTVTDSAGPIANASAPVVTVNVAPVAPLSVNATAQPTSGDAPMSVNFTGVATGGNGPYAYAWNFGDGGTGIGAGLNHTYTAAGSYAATVTVTDSGAKTATGQVPITVSPTLGATANASPTSGQAPLTVNLTGAVTGGKSPFGYSWDFGDSSQLATTQNPSHVYNNAGTYTSKLSVTDANGVTVTASAPAVQVIAAAPCTVPTLVASPAGYPQLTGTPVMLTATTTCGAQPLYQFWVKTPDGAWHMTRDYSAANTFNWTSLDTQVGNYTLEVDVKNTGSLMAYEHFTDIPYSLALCNIPTLATGTASSPYPSGKGAITLTATGSCGGGTEYEFWYRDAGNRWHIIGSGYSGSNTAMWNADYPPGSYLLDVSIRPVGSTAGYVTFVDLPFSLTGCGLPGLTPDKVSPQAAGTTITWTATVTCSGTPQYEFYVRSAAGVWSIPQPWGASNTFVWSSPATAGAYVVEVDVRNTGAVEDPYDSYIDVAYSLSAVGLCTTPTLSTGAATSPYASGTGAITLTATGTCSGGTQYEFYYRDLGNAWHIIGSGYGSSNTAMWNADYRPGSYLLEVDLRPVGSTASYVTYFDLPFSLSGCGVPGLTSDKASPQARGTLVTWTATVTCSGTPQYEFYVRSPAGGWAIIQPWGASNTFVWTSPATAGAYLVEVDVRNSGAAEDPYDSYLDVPYTLT